MQVSQSIGAIHERRPLMSAIMRQVTLAFEAERSTLFLHDPQEHQLWTLVAQGMIGDTADIRLPDDQGICGRVFQTFESLRIQDALDHPEFVLALARKTGYLPRSMLVVPILLDSTHCIGVLEVMDARVDYFGDEELTLLETIAVHVAICLENARLHEAQERQFDSFVEAFSAALDARDSTTAIHSVNVANYAVAIGQIIGLPEKEFRRLRICGLLHDIGKIGVREAILVKPGRLTPEEFADMRTHALYSKNILSRIEFTDDLRDVHLIAAAHHEKLDGSGYPDGLEGDQIPIQARILAVADIYDALTQTRHYRGSMTTARAFAILDDMAPSQLDPRCVNALKTFLGFSPITSNQEPP